MNVDWIGRKMNSILKKICLTLSLAGLGIGLSAGFTASAFAQTKSLAEINTMQGDERLQALIEGAKKEGQVTIYMAHPSMPLVNAAFTKKYGIKVNGWRAGTEAGLQRTVTEARGGRNEVDLAENGSPEMEALHREKLLQEVNSPYAGRLMPQARPAHKEWVGISIDMFTIGYNAQKVKKEDLPKTWEDLLNPRWKGTLGIEAEDQHWFAYLLQSLGEEKGIKLFKEIVASNGISVRKGHSNLAQMVSSGEVSLALDVFSWGVDQMKDKGAPIGRFTIGEPIVAFQGLGILKKAPHPYAAMLFYDFMLTDGQEIMSKQHDIATSNLFDQAAKSVPIKFIDPVTAMDLNDKRYKIYEDIFVKRVQ
jgi:iron(III) transport system substrate-binding protein